MSFFHHLQFAKVDPLANGLDDDMAHEFDEAAGTDPLADPSGEQLQENWSKIVADVEQDPDWFTFTDD